MKRSLMILFGTLLLAGCGSEKAQPVDDSNKENMPLGEETENNINASAAGQETEGNTTQEEQSDDDLFQNTEELGDVVESSESAFNNLTELPEFETVANQIDLDQYANKVKTDNKGNRVILFENAEGHKAYKSVFVKYKNRLKIIDLPKDALIFNEVIQTNTATTSTEQNDSGTTASSNVTNDGIKGFPEFSHIAENIDLDAYSGTVQTDNRGNRVMTFADANGHKKYKSIFIKHDNRLKIVHFDNDELIFNQII